LDEKTATVTANTIVAPDGTLTGDKLVANTAAALHFTANLSASKSAQSLRYTVKRICKSWRNQGFTYF
jgi:hypothetical protein